MSISAGSTLEDSPHDDSWSVQTSQNNMGETSPMRRQQFCVYCRQDTGQVEYFGPGIFAHFECRQMQVCGYCKSNFLTVMCAIADCRNVVHTWCSQLSSNTCFTHANKSRKYQTIHLGKTLTPILMGNIELAREIKQAQPNICKGPLLWFFLGINYFNDQAIQQPLYDCPTLSNENDIFDDFISQEIYASEQRLKQLMDQNLNYLGQIQQQVPSCPISQQPEGKRKMTDDGNILKYVREPVHKLQISEYLQYYEQKVKFDTGPPGNTQQSSLGLHEKPKREEDWVCGVCGDGDYEDDDLIVICGKCEMGAHMKCYGIPDIPVGEWVCDPCRVWDIQKREAIPCALCNVKGGALKPTIHLKEEFKHYNKEENPDRIWCHVFCALRVEGALFTDTVQMKNISLKSVDPRRFSFKCSECMTKNGACIQCHHGRCQTAFHPECARQYFTCTNERTGEEVSVFCRAHRQLKLRRQIEIRDKKAVRDIHKFLKHLRELAKSNPKAKFQSGDFSFSEQMQLRQEIRKVLRRINSREKTPFSISIQLSHVGSLRSKVYVTRPHFYNLIDPEIIRERRICIPTRRWSECMDYYSKTLWFILKNELETFDYPINIYYPKRRKKPIKQVQKPVKRVRRPRKIIRPQLDLFEDKVSNDVYCICKQPYVEELSWQPEWSEDEYLRRIELNNMIECEQCNDWFHYGCVNIDPNILPCSFLCPNCDTKRPKYKDV